MEPQGAHAAQTAEHNMLTPTEVLELIPQQPPFRFVDTIHEIDDDHIVASYQYRPDEYFYAGHFPGRPVTPGVVLIETIAQAGVVALGIYLSAKSMPAGELRHMVTLFTEAQAEFHDLVEPGRTVTVRARKILFRLRKLRVEATLHTDDGRLACSGTFAGMGVRRT
jgi:3-hydroxyacyl-[acyl-carrier-protein] dehydratase